MGDVIKDKYYIDLIGKSGEVEELLPFVHTCDCFSFREIFNSGFIVPQYCDVFNEELSYYFYGRPSYRVNNSSCSNLPFYFPVCFVISPECIGKIKYMYPFDTGAYKKGFYSNYISNRSVVTDYKLNNSLDFLRKFINFFYNNNKNYYDGKANVEIDKVDAMAYEIQSIYALINSKEQSQTDNRCQTIEIQMEDKLSIKMGGIKAIVLPGAIVSSAGVSEYIYDNDIELITYSLNRSSPCEITPLIIEKVRDFYQKKGVI